MNEIEELERVLGEVSEATGASACALTSHPLDGAAARIVHVESPLAALTEPLTRWVQSDAFPFQPRHAGGELAWIAAPDFTSHAMAMLLPVERVRDHNALMIILLFDRFDEATRYVAEQAYARRKPFASGYFRLWQAMQLERKRSVALQSALDFNETGVVLVDQAGRLNFANSAAQHIFHTGDGLSLRQGRVVAARLTDNVKLLAALSFVSGAAHASRDLHAPVFRVHRRDQPSLIIAALPTPAPPTEQTDTAAILFVVDPSDVPAEQLQLVCKLYSLTPVEAQLGSLLASGATLQDAAITMRLKEQTARSYLRQIFAKTNTNRQAELIRLLLASLVPTRSIVPETL